MHPVPLGTSRESEGAPARHRLASNLSLRILRRGMAKRKEQAHHRIVRKRPAAGRRSGGRRARRGGNARARLAGMKAGYGAALPLEPSSGVSRTLVGQVSPDFAARW